MYKSQEMTNLRRFLARFMFGDNQMTIKICWRSSRNGLVRKLEMWGEEICNALECDLQDIMELTED